MSTIKAIEEENKKKNLINRSDTLVTCGAYGINYINFTTVFVDEMVVNPAYTLFFL